MSKIRGTLPPDAAIANGTSRKLRVTAPANQMRDPAAGAVRVKVSAVRQLPTRAPTRSVPTTPPRVVSSRGSCICVYVSWGRRRCIPSDGSPRMQRCNHVLSPRLFTALLLRRKYVLWRSYKFSSTIAVLRIEQDISQCVYDPPRSAIRALVPAQKRGRMADSSLAPTDWSDGLVQPLKTLCR